MIVFHCSSCNAKLQAAEEHAGKTIVCPECQTRATIPSTTEPAADAITADPVVSAPAPAPPTAVTTPEHAPAAKKRTQDRDDDRDDDRDEDRPRRDRSGAGAAAAAGMGAGMIILIVVGVVGCIGLSVVGILVALLVPAVTKVREAAARTQTMNNMKEIGLAFHNSHDAMKVFPSPRLPRIQDGIQVKPQRPDEGLSWRVWLVQFSDQRFLFNQFDMKADWDGPANQPMQSQMPKMYHHLTRQEVGKQHQDTHFQVFVGPNGLFKDMDSRTKITSITDGTSNTFMFAEAKSPVLWTKPADMQVQPNGPLPLPEERFLAGFADGTVRMIDRRRTGDATIRLLIDPADHQAIPMDF